MKTTLIVIQNDADHAQAKALIEELMDSKDPADRQVARAARLPVPLFGIDDHDRAPPIASNRLRPRLWAFSITSLSLAFASATVQESMPISFVSITSHGGHRSHWPIAGKPAYSTARIYNN